MPHRFAFLAATAALGLALAGGTAYAADLPVVGSDECTVAVDADAAVKAATGLLADANGLLALLPATAPLEDRDAATDAVNEADDALASAVAAAKLRLCVDLPVTTTPPVETTTPTTTVPEPTTTTPEPATGPTVGSVRDEIDALNCDGFGEKNGQITDDTFALISSGTATSAQLGALSDALNAKLRALNYCAGATSTPTATPTTTVAVIVDPTADDGSTANTSGTQVTIVPEGSASTGA